MSKASCDANQVLRLQAEVKRLLAEAAVMREALEAAQQHFISIGWEAHPDNQNRRGRIRRIFEAAHQGKHALDAALAADAGRELLEHLQAEAAAMRMTLEAIAKTEIGYTEGDFATSCDCAYCLDMQEIAEKALAADIGRDLLERLRLAERERDEAQERIKQLKREIPARTFDIEDYQEVY